MSTAERDGSRRRTAERRFVRQAVFWCAVVTCGPTGLASAQTETGQIAVTVLDPSGASIPNATVAMAHEEDPAMILLPTPTSASGLAVVGRLRPGRYTLRVEAPGFETEVESVRIGPREVRRTVRLALEKVSETVMVGRDRQTGALDPRGFSTFLSREVIDALPDDPEEFARALRDLAPPGAVIRVDGFTGGNMPPKSQILSIRLPRIDTFAAQDHGGLSSLSFIDIITRPGGSRLQGSTEAAFRDAVLNARNPLSPGKVGESTRIGGFALDGPIIREIASFSLSARGGRQQDTATIHAALADGRIVAEPVVRPQGSLALSGRLAAALGGTRTLRVSFSSDRRTLRNLGVGDYNLADRGYRSSSTDAALRGAISGPLGRRAYVDSRVELRWAGVRNVSDVERPTIRVLDAFSSGGAQVTGGDRLFALQGAADVDYARGPHAWRAGMLLESGRYHTNRRSNYLGTFTFASLDDFRSGRPTSYTRRFGDAEVRYRNRQGGIYVQDDFRLARSLLLSYGLRYEWQTLVSRGVKLLPRAGLTWSPLRTGAATVRAGWGLFTDWIAVSAYEQSLTVDGVRQHDIHLRNPEYPDPGLGGAAGPRERYLFADDVQLPSSVGMSVGLELEVARGFRLYGSYGHRVGRHLLRGHDLNAPIDGERPDAAFANVVEARSSARSRAHTVTAQAVRTRPRSRVDVSTAYAFTRSESNTAGPFSVPASGDDGAEWGPTLPAHVTSASITARLVGSLRVSVNPRWRSGTPYTITMGRDDNGDGVFTDRPAGVPRGSARTPPQWDIGTRLSYAVRFGPPGDAASGPSSAGSDSASARAGIVAQPGNTPGTDLRRYRVEIFASAQNVTNHPNYIAVSGVSGSPFFGRPTLAGSPRKIELGARFAF